MIGKPYGTKVESRQGDGWLALLRASPENITLSVKHRTQIIYHADISLLLMYLDARPGKVLVEAGTGSGSVSTSIARAVSPGGHLHTFEYHADRQKEAQSDFVKYGLTDVITSRHGDVCKDGFLGAPDDAVDGVFLDLPAPWLAIPHLDRCVVEGGRIVSFSPCIEQVAKAAAELRRGGRYCDVRMFESLATNWAVRDDSKARKRQKVEKSAAASEPLSSSSPSYVSYPLPMRGHTGYLLVA